MLTVYYKKPKEMLPEKASESSQNISEEEKNKKVQYSGERHEDLSEQGKLKKRQNGCKRYKRILEDEKQILVEYITN